MKLDYLHLGDCLDWLKTLPSESVDAVITDPPYSSGGMMRSDRTAKPSAKYSQANKLIYTEFSGDNKDSRGWRYWCCLWISECLRIVKKSGYLLMFTDWRMLPTATDAIQSGGFIWRGLISWDKGPSARAPNTGYFRHQCEYVVWGTKGVSKLAEHGGPCPGGYQVPVVLSDKHHLTGKPTKLMRELVQCVQPEGIVLDPFAGSGTTLVAAKQEGRHYLGCELSAVYHQIAMERLGKAFTRKGDDASSGLFSLAESTP